MCCRAIGARPAGNLLKTLFTEPTQLADTNMQIEVRSDHNLAAREAAAASIKGEVERSLGAFSHRITRVDVHLSDATGGNGGKDDMHCMMETHLKGHDAIVVREKAATMETALSGAVHTMRRSLERAFDRERYQD